MRDDLYLRLIDSFIEADPRMPAEEIAKRAREQMKAIIRLETLAVEFAPEIGLDVRGMSPGDAVRTTVTREVWIELGLLCKCGYARWSWMGELNREHGRYACPPEAEK